MKRRAPPSLRTQTVVLIVLVLAASQFAWFALARWFELEPRARQIAHRAASVVTLTRAALLAAHPQRRFALLEELSRREGIRIYPLAYEDLIPPLPDDPLVRLIEAEVHRELGEDAQVIVSEDDVEGLWVSFSIGEDEYWAVMPRSPLSRPIPWPWIGWGSVVLLLSAFVAWAAVATINRPLQKIARAAQAVGRGERPTVVPESGAREIQALGHEFNRMTRELGAQEADRALLLAGVSHDLRTPLARLRLGVELNVRDAAEQDAMIADVEDMDRIIGQFLEFARPESVVESEPTNLAALLADVAESMHRRGMEIETRIDALPAVRVRREPLRRALINLIENAFRYGKPPVTLAGDVHDGHVRLTVTDRGPGIPEDRHESVKRPFQRLDTARGGAQGSGLGLAIVERVARMHGGRLTLRNVSGGGLEAGMEWPVSG